MGTYLAANSAERLDYVSFFSSIVGSMSRLLVLTCFIPLLLPVLTRAQPCGCAQNFARTEALIRENYAGYADKVTPVTRPRLDSLTQALRAQADQVSVGQCPDLLRTWLAFFHDGHLAVRAPAPPAPDPAQVRAAFAAWETVPWDRRRLLAYLNDPTRSKNPIEGLWSNPANAYEVGIVATGPAEWKAFIVRADSVWWTPGQVKATLRPGPGGTYAATYFMRDHSAQPVTAQLTGDGRLALESTWYRRYPNPVALPAPVRPIPADDGLRFVMLDDTTAYYRIPSFAGPAGRAIDSVTRANAALLRRTRLLLLDVRDNGGGSDAAYASLTPLVYTRPVHEVGLEHWATAENSKKYDFYARLYGPLPAAQRRAFARAQRRQRAHLGEFVNLERGTERTKRLRAVLPHPGRVAVLQNGRCASTTEQFLLEARQSQKVTTFGENSAGVLDYSNMYFTDLSCQGASLGWATTRSLRIRRGEGIDGVGIPPMVHLDPRAADLLEQVRAYYRRK